MRREKGREEKRREGKGRAERRDGKGMEEKREDNRRREGRVEIREAKRREVATMLTLFFPFSVSYVTIVTALC